MIYFHNIWWRIFIVFNWILIISLAFAGVVNFRHLFWNLLLLSLIHDFRRQNSLLLLFARNHLTGRFLVGERGVNAGVFFSVLRVLGSFLGEVTVFDCLTSGVTLVWVHMKKLFHQINLWVVHDSGVSGVERFWMGDFWEFKTFVSAISVKFFGKKIWKLA